MKAISVASFWLLVLDTAVCACETSFWNFTSSSYKLHPFGFPPGVPPVHPSKRCLWPVFVVLMVSVAPCAYVTDFAISEVS
jgi:hypothetical protein